MVWETEVMVWAYQRGTKGGRDQGRKPSPLLRHDILYHVHVEQNARLEPETRREPRRGRGEGRLECRHHPISTSSSSNMLPTSHLPCAPPKDRRKSHHRSFCLRLTLSTITSPSSRSHPSVLSPSPSHSRASCLSRDEHSQAAAERP